jgi:large subunit ribosomal protein L15
MIKNTLNKFLFGTGSRNVSNLNKTFTLNLLNLQKFNFCMGTNISGNFGNSSYEPITVNNIRDNKGARPVKTKLGRGPGSGKGKTSGRGHKGYKARVGNINRHYEGGQTPITRRLPKFGFRNTGRENFAYLNIDKLVYCIHKGRIDATKPITSRDLLWAGAISSIREGVKLLSRGAEQLKDLPPLHLEVGSATQNAIDEIKKAGGSIKVVYRTPTTLRYHTEPWKFIRPPIDPVPKFQKVLRLMNLEEKGAV